MKITFSRLSFFSLFTLTTRLLLFILFTLLNLPTFSHATEDLKNLEQRAGIVQRIGEQIDSSLVFTTDEGLKLPLAEIGKGAKAIIIAPVYFECPRLCSLTQEGLLKAISLSDYTLGKDFLVLSVSFNDRESEEQSKPRALAYRSQLAEKESKHQGQNWKFLTGDKDNVEKLMSQLGFKYEWDKGEYMHAAGIIFVTPEWKISRYLFNVNFEKQDFDFALLESSQGKIGDLISQALLFCFRYDHITGQYTLAIWRIIQIVCSAFSIFMIIGVVYLWKKEKKTALKEK